MLLAIDAGNTNVVFALLDRGGDIIQQWRLETEKSKNFNELKDFLESKIKNYRITSALLSSVVPGVNDPIERFCREVAGCPFTRVTAEMTGLRITLDRPEQIGADRLVNAVAVLRDYSAPAIVVDFGTATTIDVIGPDGAYCGGAIAPGVNLSLKALQDAAALLPDITFEKPEQPLGTDTVSAMKSGLYWGYVGLVEKLVEKMSGGTKPFVIATGGLSNVFADDIECIDTIDKDLTLRGLWHIYKAQLNQQDAA